MTLNDSKKKQTAKTKWTCFGNMAPGHFPFHDIDGSSVLARVTST